MTNYRNKIERVKILGVPVDNVDMALALRLVDELIKNDQKGNYILSVNPEKVIALQNDLFLKKMFEGAALLTPDGIGVVIALRWLYGLSAKRVPGSELMPNICKAVAKKRCKIFIYGSKEEVNKGAVEKLNILYPGIRIVGRCNGYIGQQSMEKLIYDINESQADILFVAMGSPKQEQWIKKYLPRLNVKICQGIGGTLDTIVGVKKRAPKLFLSTGLEWFHRLISEPKRIRRQTVLPIFALKVIKEKIKG